MSNKHATLSWAQRFALLDQYKPSDEQACVVFGLSKDELTTARDLRTINTFGVASDFDAVKYGNPFEASAAAQSGTTTTKTTRPGRTRTSATVHTKPADDGSTPQTATKKVKVKIPQKRGRKGDKIQQALLAVPQTPISVDDFRKQHGISLAVLRQSKRFISKMEATVQKQIGTIRVRQDRGTKVLMIWREIV